MYKYKWHFPQKCLDLGLCSPTCPPPSSPGDPLALKPERSPRFCEDSAGHRPGAETTHRPARWVKTSRD